MNIKQIQVTPSIAKEYLAKNMPQNRRIKEQQITKIAADILAGKWIDCGDTIKFNKLGFLIDGQHRLQAIVKANKPVKLWVATDVDDEAVNVIDTGKSRNLADVLTINGKGTNAPTVAALARKIMSYQGGNIAVMGEATKSRARIFSTQQLLAYCMDNDLIPYVNFGMNCYAQAVSREILTSGEWIFSYWLLSQKDPAAGAMFLMDLAKLRGSEDGVIRQLFTRLTRSAIGLDATTKLKVIVRCWNAWRTDQQPQLKLRTVQEEAVPELV